MQPNLKSKPLVGLLVANVIVFLWIVSLAFLFSIDSACLLPLGILLAILGRTFIQTGLFIVAHDAIHGSVSPGSRRLNHWIGQFAVTLYALLSYRKLSLNHWQHHRLPGQAGDPDFHDGVHNNIIAWYVRFMKTYLDTRQIMILVCSLGTLFLVFHSGFHIPIASLFLFWILPIILSSMQLFVFGTYLPHRSTNSSSVESDPTQDAHHITSSGYSPLYSFLACYHFDYHWEHHEYPSLAWYRLPSVRQGRSTVIRSAKSVKASVLSALKS